MLLYCSVQYLHAQLVSSAATNDKAVRRNKRIYRDIGGLRSPNAYTAPCVWPHLTFFLVHGSMTGFPTGLTVIYSNVCDAEGSVAPVPFTDSSAPMCLFVSKSMAPTEYVSTLCKLPRGPGAAATALYPALDRKPMTPRERSCSSPQCRSHGKLRKPAKLCTTVGTTLHTGTVNTVTQQTKITQRLSLIHI